MKELTMEQWEKKYLVEAEKKRFDRKNNRPGRGLEDGSFLGDIKDKAGFTQQDQALRWGARRGTVISRFSSKPASSPPDDEAGGSVASSSPDQALASAMSRGGSATAVASPPEKVAAVASPAKPAGGASPAGMNLNYKPPEGLKIDTSEPEVITRDIKKVARYFGADLVGVCKLDRRWVYEDGNIPEEYEYAIVMAYEEDYELIKHFPSYISDAATSMGYSDMAVTNTYLTSFIENLGFKAIASGNDTALSVPMAIQAGLGDHGRLGFLITPQFGPRVRLSKVFTDLPLVVDSPIDFGVTEFCAACKKCAKLCPSQSIPYGDRTTEANNTSNSAGELKWRINAESCRMYWGQVNKPCTTCMACCPYNKPNTWPHKTTRWFTDHARWADPFYIKMDELFGYGKPMKSGDLEKFWNEWQP